MKLVFFLITFPALSWGISPHEFNQVLLEGVREDIKQERFQERIPSPAERRPASFIREEFEKEYQRKNKVNGLHEKW